MDEEKTRIGMKINIDLKAIVIFILLGIIVFSFIFRNDIAEKLRDSKEVVRTVIVEKEVISQKMLDSLVLIPIYERRFDSVLELLAIKDDQLINNIKDYEELIIDIDDNSADDDIKFFTGYLSNFKED